MHAITAITLLVVCCFRTAMAATEDQYVFDPEASKHSLVDANVMVDRDKKVHTLGSVLRVRLWLNNACGDYLFNPEFSETARFPAVLAIFNENREYLGNLLAYLDDPTRRNVQGVWFQANGSHYGRWFELAAGADPRKKDALLPPGRYYLQVFYYVAAISMDLHPKPYRIYCPPDAEGFMNHFDTTEAGHSRPVLVEFVEVKLAAEPAATRPSTPRETPAGR